VDDVGEKSTLGRSSSEYAELGVKAGVFAESVSTPRMSDMVSAASFRAGAGTGADFRSPDGRGGRGGTAPLVKYSVERRRRNSFNGRNGFSEYGSGYLALIEWPRLVWDWEGSVGAN
jgi:hypothetical protein